MDDQDRQEPDEPSASEPITLPWHEPGERDFKDMFTTATIVLLLALAVVGFVNAARGVEGSQMGSAILAIVLAVAGLMSWYGPFGSVGLRSTVDRAGLHVRHQGWRLPPSEARIELSVPRHLPAEQIGDILVVTEEKRRRMWTKSMSLTYEGRRLGWMRTTVDKETVEAVMVEQVASGLKRPWWLLRCNDCAGLVQALELAKSQAQTASDH